MGKVSVIATLTCKDGKGDSFPAAFDDFFRHVEGETGTEEYVLHRSTTNPNVFFMTELYADQASDLSDEEKVVQRREAAQKAVAKLKAPPVELKKKSPS